MARLVDGVSEGVNGFDRVVKCSLTPPSWYGHDLRYVIDTFAAVVKQLAWRLLFALAVLNKWIIYKIDMISAFTQGNIDINIYIKQPLGHIVPNNPNSVLRLNKALYGLKQSARIWYYLYLKRSLSK